MLTPFKTFTDVYEIASHCSKCGTTIAEEQSKYGLCEKCETGALAKFKYFLEYHFTDNEREYIDACTEGVSLTEPNKFKDIKAVY